MIFVLLSVTSLSLGLVASSPAAAADCPETAIIDIDCSGDENPIFSILIIVINVMAALVGLAAIGGFIYGAVLYTSAGDKAAQVTKAKETLANVVLGIVCFALMWAFLQFLIPGGVFNREYTTPASTAPAPPPDDDSGGNDDDNDDPNNNGVSLSSINLKNLRDAATTTNGNILKRGVLYRSSQLHNLNGQNQPAKLGQLLGDDAIIIDLRPENSPPDKSIPGVNRINIPIAGWTDEVDVAVTDPARRSGLGRALKTMASADGPVLLHCIAGKDRTGWLVAMIMYVNGANDQQLMKEYLKSNDSGYTVKREWLNTGLSAARSEYGSIPKYLKHGLGLNDNDLRKLRQKFGA